MPQVNTWSLYCGDRFWEIGNILTLLCAEGTIENSPAIHRWVRWTQSTIVVPEGRLMRGRQVISRPSGTLGLRLARCPSNELLGYSQTVPAGRQCHGALARETRQQTAATA